MRHIRIETDGEGIATLTLDHADKSMNLVTDEWIDEMREAIDTLAADDAVRGVLIVSAKPQFLAGADLGELIEGFDTRSVEDAYALSSKSNAMHRALETMGKPVACAIEGLCLGGGYELALACTWRILDQNGAVGLPEVKLGLMPGSGGTQRLPRMIGARKALDAMLTGRTFRAADALRAGLVDAVAPASELADRARAWLKDDPDATRPWDDDGFAIPEARGMVLPEAAAGFTMATAAVAKQAGYNYPAPVAILSAVFEGLQLPFERGLSIEAKYFATLLTHPVARNIARTSFISRNAARKGLRRPDGVERRRVEKIGVLGAGMMGAGIALVAAQAGIEVVLLDRDLETAKKGRAYTEKVLGRSVAKGRLQREELDAILARITPTDDFALLEGAGLVVEAVFEDIEIKAETTRKAEAVLPDDAIFATNTSTLPITKLAEASARPDQFIGLHFFSPVDRMELVEVIMGEKTSPETLAHSLDFIAQIGKTPIVVNDSRGFYTSRVFQMLINEGAAMLGEGVEPARIENAAIAAGFPVGPLALLDEVTLTLPLMVVDQAIAQEGDAYDPPVGVPVMRRMVELGRTGKKDGAGFYDYPEEGKRLWTGLAEHFESAGEQPDIESLKTRFLYAQAVETARCLEEGVLETPQDADLGAVFGWGFPLWTGGTLSYIDTIGIEEFVETAERMAQRHGPRFSPSPWLRQRADQGKAFYGEPVD